jgi:hypothetical protein
VHILEELSQGLLLALTAAQHQLNSFQGKTIRRHSNVILRNREPIYSSRQYNPIVVVDGRENEIRRSPVAGWRGLP